MDDREKIKRRQKRERQFIRAFMTLIYMLALGWVLFLGIRWNGFENIWWWLSLLAVGVLIVVVSTFDRRMSQW